MTTTPDRFDRIRTAVGRLAAHRTDPAASREAAELARAECKQDERDLLAAVAVCPMTAREAEIVFPHWEPGHAAKRLSDLKAMGFVDTDDTRRAFPGRRVPSSQYRATTVGVAVADRWPAANPPVAATIRDGLEKRRRDLPDNPVEAWPCPFCSVRRPNRAGLIRHLQRSHALPRVDASTGRAVAA